MDDQRDPNYTPFGQPRAARASDPVEPLWTLQREGIDWSCEMVFRGESYGWEARVVRNQELFYSRRFLLREPAMRWARELRRQIERGWIDDA